LVESLARARGVEPAEVANYGRAGDEALRVEGEIGVQAIRGGTVPGDHTVYYFGENERIEITHRASSRAVFAQGAVRAACWLAPKKGDTPALYSMADVLTA
jgi:4-hydroxy-tetrahydrodipicolinate reductase